MTWGWLQSRSGITQMAERVDLLERQLTDIRQVAQGAIDRLAAAERMTIETASAVATMHQQVRALRRAMRSGANRLDQLLSANAGDAVRAETYEAEVERLKMALAFVEGRIEEEAEQARRGLTGLLDHFRQAQSASSAETSTPV